MTSNTNFDAIAFRFTPETLDMVNDKFVEMQKEGFDFSVLDFSDDVTPALILAYLESAVEVPSDPNLLLRLAALILAVIEVSVGTFYE